jgi:squalene cyclase
MGQDTTSNLAKGCTVAIQHATDFLVRNALPSGGWADFQTNRSGESTSWVTGHVLWYIGRLLPREIVDGSVAALLAGRHATGGWGYSERTPPDCDSTLHVLHAFHVLGILGNVPDVERAFEFVLTHQTADGGFSTFGNGPELAAYRGHGTDLSYEGWAQAHMCVTAIALQTLPYFRDRLGRGVIERMIDFVIGGQSQEGFWESYWWRSKVFATARILSGLRSCKIRDADDVMNRGLRWLQRAVDEAGFYSNGYDLGIACPVSTALAVKALADSQDQSVIPANSVLWLLGEQRSDGSWIGKPVLQIPPPELLYPNVAFPWRIGGQGVGSCSADMKRIYTTATIAGAISHFLQLGRRER